MDVSSNNPSAFKPFASSFQGPKKSFPNAPKNFQWKSNPQRFEEKKSQVDAFLEKKEDEKKDEVVEVEVDDLTEDITILLNIDDAPASKLPEKPVQNDNNSKYAYTKFCNNLIEKGICQVSHCTFAHSLKQYRPPVCINGNRCYNIHNPHRICKFAHPGEDVNTYMQRTKMTIHPNILSFTHNEDVVVKIEKEKKMIKKVEEKLVEVKEQVKLEKLDHFPLYPEVVLKTNINSLTKEMSKLTNLGYKNINVVLDGNETRIFNTIPWVYFKWMNDVFQKMTFENSYRFDNNDRDRLNFYVSDGGFILDNITVFGKDEKIKVGHHFSGLTSGWDLIDFFHKKIDEMGYNYMLKEIKLVEDGHITTFDLEVSCKI